MPLGNVRGYNIGENNLVSFRAGKVTASRINKSERKVTKRIGNLSSLYKKESGHIISERY